MNQPRPGDAFRGFRIESELGQGGFAIVYAARRLADGMLYALKVLKPDHGDGYRPDTRARVAREVEILQRLASPHTVRLFEHGVAEDGLLYMVFEHLPGQDLSEILKLRGRLPAGECVPILRQLLFSLQEAHNYGLLHRDLKPQNIRVIDVPNGPPFVKLMDFGIARSGEDGHPSLTATGEIIGTPRYMSPEQLMAKPLGPASDLYSLGMVALEMVAGSQALSGNRLGEQIDRMQTGYLFSIAEASQTDARLTAVIQRMTEKDVESRFASAQAVFRALEFGPEETAPVDVVAAPEKATSRRALVVLGVAALLVVVVVAASLRSPEPERGRALENRGRNALIAQPSTPSPPSIEPTPDLGAPEPPDAGVPVPDLPTDLGPVEPCGADSRPRRSGVFAEAVSHVPKGYKPGKRHPLVVLLHDDGHSAADLLEDSGFRGVAESENLLVVAPTGESTNDNVDLDHFNDAVDSARAAACVDADRVFLVTDGKSGRTAFRASCAEPRRVAAIAANNFTPERIVGRDGYDCSGPIPVMWLTPTVGRAEPLDGQPGPCAKKTLGWEALVEWWRTRNHCSDRPTVREVAGGTCSAWDCPTAFESCEIKGQGGWPGTGPHMKWCLETAPDVDIAPEVWRFFSKVDVSKSPDRP